MALPLPKVVADIGPGGGLVTAMGGMNSLANDMILRQINAIKKQYAPITAQSEAASKLAYANLMGPQFLAKLMGNDSALANMSEDQKRNALATLYRAGSGQGTGNSLMQPQSMPMGVGQPSTNTFSGWVGNALKNAFGQTQANQNPLTQAMPTAPSAPRGQYTPQEAAPSREPGVGDAVYGDDINHEADQAYDAWLQSPEGKSEVAKGESANMPTEEEVVQWYRNKSGKPTGMKMTLTKPMGRQPTYAENTGTYKGVVEEGQESGKIRAKDIEQLNNSVFNAETNQATH